MFLTPLALRGAPTPDLWVIDAPLVWCDPTFGRISVPVGFITDLASTPFHIGDTGVSRRPAAVHDALYRLGRAKGKPWADAFLRASLKAEGGGRCRALVYYLGVHWFGRAAYAGDAVLDASAFETPGAFDAYRRGPGIFG